MSVFFASAAKHDVDVRDREAADLQLEFGVVKDIRKKIRDGFDQWKSVDLLEDRYRMATVRYK